MGHKVQKVKISNFKVLENFEADFSNKSVYVRAKNKKGKTSLLQFIDICLGSQSVVPKGIEDGKAGTVWTNKDGQTFEFNVRFKDSKPIIEVKSNGLKDSSKGILHQIAGSHEFDPNKFIALSNTKAGRKEQIEIYKSFLPQETQDFLKEIEGKIEKTYQERTDINRDIKKLEAAIEKHELSNYQFSLDQFKSVDIKSVYDQLQKANSKNEKIVYVEKGITDKKDKIKELEERRAALLREIGQINDTIDTCEKDIENGQKWLTENKKVDVKEFEAKIQSANETNKKYESAKKLKADLDMLKKLKDESEDMTVLIESSKQAIKDTVQQLDVLDGLTYDEDGLIYNGVPVTEQNMSTSQRMFLGIKLKMLESPEISFVTLNGFESIDEDTAKEIQQFAEENDIQLIVEEVVRGQEELKIELMGE